MNSDAELQQALIQIDREVPLDDRALDRIEERMLARFDFGNIDDEVGGDVVRLVGRGERERRVRHNVSWLLRAAAAVLLVGGAVAGAAFWIGGSEPSEQLPADSVDIPTPTVQTTVAPFQTPAAPQPVTVDGANGLGYRAFTSYNYIADSESKPAVAPALLTDRIGEMASDGDVTSLSVRRSIVGGDSESAPRALTLAIVDEALVAVPLDWIDPIEFGGTCVGGSVIVGPSMPAAGVVVAGSCSGSVGDVLVAASAGVAQSVSLGDAIELDAVPITILLTATTQPTVNRSVTLWFSADGLVRRTHTIDDTPIDYNLDPINLDDLGSS